MVEIDDLNRKWINAAKEEHRKMLDPDRFGYSIRDIGDKPYITVMGPTQGGKTTLILRLMGLDGSNFQTVYYAIRADRPEGSKSTPCPTVYKVSNDDNYEIRLKHKDVDPDVDNTVYTDSTVCKKLKELYDNQSLFSCSSVLHISIPRKYVKIEEGIEPVMIDLPGFDGYGDTPEAVNGMYEEWVTKANCVFLVVYAEHMYKLNELEEQCHNEFPKVVQSWKAIKDRFKIVLTAYTKNQTEQKHWESESHELSFATLNQRIIDTLKDPNKGIRDCPEWLWNNDSSYSVFAFDYGESWFQLESTNKVLTKKMKPILDHHFKKLKEAIRNSTNEVTSLRSECNLSPSFDLLLKKKEEEYNECRKELKESLAKQVYEIETLCLNLKGVKDKQFQLESENEKLSQVMKGKLSEEPPFEYDADIDKRREQIYDKYRQIKNEISSLLIALHSFVEEHIEKKWQPELRQKIINIESKMNPGIDIESLLRNTYKEIILGIKWLRKKGGADDYIRDEMNKWKMNLKQDLSQCVDYLKYQVKNRIGGYGADEKLLEISIKRAKSEKHEIDVCIDLLKKDFSQQKSELIEAKSKADILPMLLKAHFSKHRTAMMRLINKPLTTKDANDLKRQSLSIDSICMLLFLQKGAMLLRELTGD